MFFITYLFDHFENKEAIAVMVLIALGLEKPSTLMELTNFTKRF